MSASEQDDRGGITRRRALLLAGTAGAGAAFAGGGAIGALTGGDDDPGVDAAEAASCVLTPSMTEGPYFVDERLNRSDIRGDRDGVPLALTVNVFSASAGCDPYEGAVVDIWQCDAQGMYSDISAAGNGDTSGQTWLRGLQVTGADGRAEFTTIYPGWYQGRTVHIHMKVRTFGGEATTYNFNTQLFFPETTTDQVLGGVAAYSRGQARQVTNANDDIYDADMVLPLSGSIAEGFTASVDVGLTGLPDEGTTDLPDVEESDDSVAAELASVKVVSRPDGRRAVVVAVKAGERARLDARLIRSGRLLARRRTGMRRRGRHELNLRVGRGAAAGSARVRVLVVDQAGNRKVLTRKVRIPRRKD